MGRDSVGGFEGRVMSQGNSVGGRMSKLSNSGAVLGELISHPCCCCFWVSWISWIS
jgi:hypothetical protein